MKKNQTHPNNVDCGVIIKATSVATIAGVLACGISTQASTDYGPAVWRPACSGHWNTSGNGHRFVVIHDMEGYYAYNVLTFLPSCSSTVSIHYCVNGKKDAASDMAAGEVTQCVRDAYYAWHALCWNSYSCGTEHEGFVSNPAWFTEELYQASAGVQRHLCDTFGIPKDRNHIVGHNEKSNGAWVAWAPGGLGINPSCNTHSDPGPYWDWNHFMALVNPPANNNINIFYAGTDNALWTKYWYNGAWGGGTSLNGSMAAGSSPCTVNSGQYLSCFYRGSDNALYIKQSDGVSWSGANLGGSGSSAMASDPTAIIAANGNYSIFYRGADGALWTKYFTPSGWGGPTSLGGAIAAGSSPSAVTSGVYVTAFYRGTDNALHSIQWNGTAWSSPSSQGGTGSSAMASNPNAIIAASGNYNILYRGADGALWTIYWTPASGWGAPYSLGGAVAANSTPATFTTGVYLNIYYRGTDNALYIKQWTGSAWIGPTNLGGAGSSAMSSNPTTTMVSNGNQNVFYRGADGALWTIYWTSTSGWAPPYSLGGAIASGCSPSAMAHQ